MRNILLLVSYDGTMYHGWQCQPNGITIQETLHKTVETITNREVKLVGGARTDAGVHAQSQGVNFLTDCTIDCRSLMKGLNSLLPPDIRVHDVSEVSMEFHARYSAKSKTYMYCIHTAPCHSPFHARYAWHYPYPLNAASMNETVKLIIGEHDFSAFKKMDEKYRSPVRKIKRAGVKRRNNFVYVMLEATGFLRYMVRNIVGTLVLVGSGKISADRFGEILDSRDRRNAGPTAPAKGLFLRNIHY